MVQSVYEKKVLELLTSQGRLFTIAAFCVLAKNAPQFRKIYGSSKLAVQAYHKFSPLYPRMGLPPPSENLKKRVAKKLQNAAFLWSLNKKSLRRSPALINLAS